MSKCLTSNMWGSWKCCQPVPLLFSCCKESVLKPSVHWACRERRCDSMSTTAGGCREDEWEVLLRCSMYIFFQGIFDFEAVLGGLMVWLMQRCWMHNPLFFPLHSLQTINPPAVSFTGMVEVCEHHRLWIICWGLVSLSLSWLFPTLCLKMKQYLCSSSCHSWRKNVSVEQTVLCRLSFSVDFSQALRFISQPFEGLNQVNFIYITPNYSRS